MCSVGTPAASWPAALSATCLAPHASRRQRRDHSCSKAEGGRKRTKVRTARASGRAAPAHARRCSSLTPATSASARPDEAASSAAVAPASLPSARLASFGASSLGGVAGGGGAVTPLAVAGAPVAASALTAPSMVCSR